VATSTIAGIGEVERRALFSAGLRATISTGVLLSAYFFLPITVRHSDHSLLRDLGTMTRLGVAAALFISVLMFEIRGITRAKHPMLQAGVAMAVIVPLFLVTFAWTYLNMSASDAVDFGGHMTRVTALYFTVTIFSTVGFGDITPHTDLARLVTTVQMIADLIVIAVVVRLILGTASRSADARLSEASTD
jgi:voltage-gated potassium channel